MREKKWVISPMQISFGAFLSSGIFAAVFFIFLTLPGFVFRRAAGRRTAVFFLGAETGFFFLAGGFFLALAATAFFFFTPGDFFADFLTGRLTGPSFRDTPLRLTPVDFFLEAPGLTGLRDFFTEARLVLRFLSRAFCVFWSCLIRELRK